MLNDGDDAMHVEGGRVLKEGGELGGGRGVVGHGGGGG